MKKDLLEYDQCHCSKIDKEVMITSMVFNESINEAVPDKNKKQAFDCDQKEHCGVLTISGNEIFIDWFRCAHPKFLAGSDSMPYSTRQDLTNF